MSAEAAPEHPEAAEYAAAAPELERAAAAAVLTVALDVAKINRANEVHISRPTAERVIELLKEPQS